MIYCLMTQLCKCKTMENMREQIEKQLDYYESVTNARRDKTFERGQMKKLLQKENKIAMRTPYGGTRITAKFIQKGNYKKTFLRYRRMNPTPKYRVVFNKQVFTFATKEQFFLWLYRRSQILMNVNPEFGEILFRSTIYMQELLNRKALNNGTK